MGIVNSKNSEVLTESDNGRTFSRSSAMHELALAHVSEILECKRYINTSEERKRNALKCNPEKYPFVIKDIDNPTDEMCEFAIGVNENNIENIPKERQTHNLCVLALQKNGLVIRSIRNQTEELQLLAAQQNPKSIFEMQNPSLSTIYLAVRLGGEEVLEELVKRGNVEEGSKFYVDLREEAFHHDDVYSV